MESLYQIIYSVCLSLTAAAAVIGGYKVYAKWNRGEEVMPSLSAWLLGLIVAVVLLNVGDMIKAGSLLTTGTNPQYIANDFAVEVFELALILGVITAIVGTIRIYRQYNDGEDVHDSIIKWVGSIFFLFFFGYLIEAFF